MKSLRVLICIFFLISVGTYMGYKVYTYQTTDRTYPVLASTAEEIQVPCDFKEEELVDGLTANDAKDGDLTSQILVGQISNFIEPGTSNISYAVFDSDNHAATYSRRIIFENYESPKFELSKPLIFTNSMNLTLSDRLIAVDKIEGDITDRLRMKDIVYTDDSMSAGNIHVSVSNRFGDESTLLLPVLFTDTKELAIEIKLSQYLVYIKKGETFKAKDYIEEVTSEDGVELSKNKVKINQKKVNTEKEGIYIVTYRYKTEESEGITRLLVVVEE